LRPAAAEGTAGAKSLRLDRKDILLMAGLFVAALLIRLYFIPFFKVISADGVGYVTAARSLSHGNLSELTIYGVVYPTLAATANLLTGDMELAGRYVSAFMGSLLVVPLYLLGMEFFSKRAALLACILVLAWPPLRMWAGEVMTQGTYITLMLTGVYAMWVAFRKDSGRHCFGAGMLMAFVYLTRPEALVTFLAVGAALVFPARVKGLSWKRIAGLIAATGAGFAIPLIPYVFLVHSVTGKWQLAGKTANTLADALSQYLQRPDMKNEASFKGIGVLDVIRLYPDFLWGNFLKNLKETLQTMVPPYLWVLSLVGIVGYGWSREKCARQLVLLATFAPLSVIMVLFFVGPEYLQPYLPILFLWAASGLLLVEERLASYLRLERFGLVSKVRRGVPASALVAGWITVSVLVAQVRGISDEPYHYSQDGGRYDQKRIGLRLKKLLPPGSRVMTRWGRITFYSEMEMVMIPQAGYPELLDAIRTGKVKYVIVDGMLTNARPQFGLLYRPLFETPETIEYSEQQAGGEVYKPLPNLKLIYLHKDPSSIGLAVYEVMS
jgi:hypothetical protein